MINLPSENFVNQSRERSKDPFGIMVNLGKLPISDASLNVKFCLDEASGVEEKLKRLAAQNGRQNRWGLDQLGEKSL